MAERPPEIQQNVLADQQLKALAAQQNMNPALGGLGGQIAQRPPNLDELTERLAQHRSELTSMVERIRAIESRFTGYQDGEPEKTATVQENPLGVIPLAHFVLDGINHNLRDIQNVVSRLESA